MTGDSFHAGERRVQERAGGWSDAVIGSTIPPIAAAYLTEQPMIVVAGRDADRRVWITLLAGAPGFLEAVDERTVHVHAVPLPGDPLAPLVAGGGHVGMISVDDHRRMRVNGVLTPRPDGFIVRADQVFANCHKYISERHPTPSSERPGEAVRGTGLTEAQAARIMAADMFYVGTSHPDGPADASHRGGNPGFVVVDSPGALRWPDYVGNAMYMTLGNIVVDPHVGLVFPDWETGDLLQVSGRAHLDWEPGPGRRLPGGERLVEVAVDAVVDTPRAVGLRWGAPVLSRFNPPLTVPA